MSVKTFVRSMAATVAGAFLLGAGAAQAADLPVVPKVLPAEVKAPEGVTLRSLVEAVGEAAALEEARGSLERVAEQLASDADALTAERT